MRLRDGFHVLIVWFFLLGAYLLLRTRSLKYEFKESGEKSFLDFFESKYLGVDKPTWRRRYNFIYNSRLYWIISWCLIVTSFVLCAVILVLYIVISSTEYKDYLDMKVM